MGRNADDRGTNEEEERVCSRSPQITLASHLLCRDRVPTLLDKLRLGHGGVRVEGTPRRLAVIVHQLAGRQSNSEEKVRGPPAKVSPVSQTQHLLCA